MPDLDKILANYEYPSPTHAREIGEGRIAWIAQFIFTCAIVTATLDLLDEGYDDRWCYETKEDAIEALKNWDPTKDKEPTGWYRHPSSGRRRSQGDPSKEYILK